MISFEKEQLKLLGPTSSRLYVQRHPSPIDIVNEAETVIQEIHCSRSHMRGRGSCLLLLGGNSVAYSFAVREPTSPG